MTGRAQRRLPSAESGFIAADWAARHWTWPVPGDLSIGSDARRGAVCRMFHNTFNPYRPSIID